MKSKFILQYACVLFLGMMYCNCVKAQLNSLGTGYFQNQYLYNPAMSGLNEKQANLGTGYRKYGNVTNGPQSIYLLGDYGFNAKMGVGVNVFFDKAGLINTSKIMGTYTYHMQVGSEDQKVHFGLSLGGVQTRLNNKEITGDIDDPSLYNFNDQHMKFETDFGVAYTDGKLNVQAALPNMISTFRNDEKNLANRSIFFAAASYKVKVSEEADGITIEPKIAFRGIKGNSSIFDAGANVTFLEDKLNVFGLYHTNKSITAGAGIKIASFAQITALYSTQASELKTYSGGDFEIGLRFNLK